MIQQGSLECFCASACCSALMCCPPAPRHLTEPDASCPPQVLGLDLMKSGILSVLPWITMSIFANVGGWLADTMVDRGVSVTFVRKLMQTLGFLGPALFLSQLSHATSIPAAVMCMMGAQGLDAFSQSGLYSNHQDIGPRCVVLCLHCHVLVHECVRL